jgi:hypothetical protein
MPNQSLWNRVTKCFDWLNVNRDVYVTPIRLAVFGFPIVPARVCTPQLAKRKSQDEPEAGDIKKTKLHLKTAKYGCMSPEDIYWP